jgi:hypothetical protein
MSRVFIGGSRHLSRLHPDVRKRLDRIVEKHLMVLIGDANGVDKAVQTYFFGHRYRNVEVFCSAGRCRNNVGNWHVRSIKAQSRPGTFDFYAAKDRLMAIEADAGFMIWDGKSKGTLLNVFRLIKNDKAAVVYRSSDRHFWELRHLSDWEGFAVDTWELKRGVEQIEAAEEMESRLSKQRNLLLPSH